MSGIKAFSHGMVYAGQVHDDGEKSVNKCRGMTETHRTYTTSPSKLARRNQICLRPQTQIGPFMTSLAACWTETFGERTRTTKPTTESRRQKSNCSFLLIFSMKMAMTQTKMQFCRIGPIYRFVVDFVVATFFFVVDPSFFCRQHLHFLSSQPGFFVVDPQYFCRRPTIFLSSPQNMFVVAPLFFLSSTSNIFVVDPQYVCRHPRHVSLSPTHPPHYVCSSTTDFLSSEAVAFVADSLIGDFGRIKRNKHAPHKLLIP